MPPMTPAMIAILLETCEAEAANNSVGLLVGDDAVNEMEVAHPLEVVEVVD